MHYDSNSSTNTYYIHTEDNVTTTAEATKARRDAEEAHVIYAEIKPQHLGHFHQMQERRVCRSKGHDWRETELFSSDAYPLYTCANGCGGILEDRQLDNIAGTERDRNALEEWWHIQVSKRSELYRTTLIESGAAVAYALLAIAFTAISLFIVAVSLGWL